MSRLRLPSLALILCPFLLVDCGARYESATGGQPDRARAYVCEEPERIRQAGTDVDSGFVRCADGFIHRAIAVTCVDPRGVGDCGPLPWGTCSADEDCTQTANGTCNRHGAYCGCTYGCAVDADCEAGEICACAGVVGSAPRCIPAGCVISSDCAGSLCGLSVREGDCADLHGELACVPVDRGCRVDADCSDAPSLCDGEPDEATECAIDEGVWKCTAPSCGNCG